MKCYSFEEVQKTRTTIKKQTKKVRSTKCFAFILRLIESSHSFRFFYWIFRKWKNRKTHLNKLNETRFLLSLTRDHLFDRWNKIRAEHSNRCPFIVIVETFCTLNHTKKELILCHNFSLGIACYVFQYGYQLCHITIWCKQIWLLTTGNPPYNLYRI